MALLRLLGAGWVLVRADALLPREAQGLMPAPLVALGKILRLLAGPQSRRGRPGERLAKALEGLGPVAIKLGQLLSTRADILGTDFADDLARLKDQLQPFDTKLASAVVQAGIDRLTACHTGAKTVSTSRVASMRATFCGSACARAW